MAHEVQANMDTKTHLKSTILNRPNLAKCEHLKPLSIYANMITCDQKDSLLHQRMFTNSFINFKIEILNNCAGKRKLDGTSRDDGYETPAKKALSPKALSPDLGCFMDYSSPPERRASPFAISKPELLDLLLETQASRGEERGSSREPEGTEGTVPHSLTCDAPSFDCDVDNILCLNPVGTNVEGCGSRNKPVLIPTEAQGQGGEEPKKEVSLNVEDKGYFSMSYINALKTGKDPSQYPPATSSPLLSRGEDDQPNSESPSESDLCPIVRAPPVEPLEGDIDEWSIGQPIFESSMCHSVTVKLNNSEQSRELSEEVQGGMIEPVHECPDSLGGEGTTLDTSYETTLPLQVQVKSVVVALGLHASSGKPAAPPLPEHSKPSPKESGGSQPAKCVHSARRDGRPVVFDRKGDWEREKRLYINSVTRHMNEKQGSVKDAMSELLDLMTHVADQTPDTGGRQWQHPSDLTRRNYLKRFGNTTPTMTLQEWQEKNGRTHKRFSKVPKIFQRSSFP